METAISAGTQTYGSLALALMLGLLIGLQRGWVQRDQAEGSRFAGIRTFGLLGLAGGIAGWVRADSPLAWVILVSAAALVLAGYWRSSRKDSAISGTASVAGLLTLGIGYLAGSGALAAASAITGVTMVLLSLRGPLHHLLRHIDENEMRSVARFALIALAVLPLLPDTSMGPLDAWRPRQLWLVVVLVSGFSFTGYVAARWLGPSRGVLGAAAAGSMVSSTAVTTVLGGLLGKDDGSRALLNAGVALGGAVMFARVLALTGFLAGFALPVLAVLLAPGLLAGLAATALILRGSGDSANAPEALPIRNPFDLKPALALMGLTMVLTVCARWVLVRYGDTGLAGVLALSGVVDVDSAIITMGNLPAGTLTARTGGIILLVPVVANTLFKTGVLLALAGWRRAWPAAASLLASAALCGLSLLVML